MTDPKTPIAVTLEAQEWNTLLDCLADGCFRTVSPLIRKIVEQAQVQAETAPRPHLVPAS